VNPTLAARTRQGWGNRRYMAKQWNSAPAFPTQAKRRLEWATPIILWIEE